MRGGDGKGKRKEEGRSGRNGGGWQKETRSWALNIGKWEDGQRRRGKGDSSSNEPRDGRRDAALGCAEHWAGAGMRRVGAQKKVRSGVPGRKKGRCRPSHPPSPQHGRARSWPLTLLPARGRGGRRKRCSCGRHRCSAQRPKMEPSRTWTWPGPKTPPAAVRSASRASEGGAAG